MPWRSGPQAALALALPSAVALFAASNVLRTHQPAPDTSRSANVLPSIDRTLARDEEGCAGARSTVWHPLSGVEYTGRLRVALAPRLGGAIVFYVGDSVPLTIDAETLDGQPVLLHRERLLSGPGAQVPPDFWLDDNGPWSAPREITRVTVDALPTRALSFVISLGRRAPRVLARLIGYPDDVRVPVCAQALSAGETYFASGWLGDEQTAEGRVRWMSDHGAVLVSSPQGRATRVRIRAMPAVPSRPGDETTLTLRVNDVYEFAAVAMRGEMATYEWAVPDSTWVTGTNELFFRVSRTETRGTRAVGLALVSLHAD